MEKEMNVYDKVFYLGQMAGSMSSAERIVPYVMDMLSPIQIKSVVDFGCGVGGWLAQFKKHNTSIDVKGLDFGKPNVSQLQIAVEDYKRKDLSKKIVLGRKFDLCISLEVAEHIPSKYADIFIDNLCRHSDIILFSAAIPAQEGMNHVNERPLSYWVRKFRWRGYNMYDVIRPFFWDDKKIDVWYRQNIVLFVKDGIEIEGCCFRNESNQSIIDIVHPELFYSYCKMREQTLINWRYLYAHYGRFCSVFDKIREILDFLTDIKNYRRKRDK